ncbi:helix-turn-helix domain-containing protein [Stigmatella aurantiaca]|nr:LysR family transcriptional regulator [Stigmatella aurantiaca]ADO70922.1 Transcriptional regulator, LysR family [Stigmatella aurantiaca DW4/3-1]
MDIPWEDVRLFLAVAETGSLSSAARKLRIGQPTVSRRLAALEYTLGMALFRRGVDGLRHKKPAQEGLTVVKSFSIESAAFASKTLAARLPRKPRLAGIPWLAFAPPMDTLPPNPQLEQLIPGFTPVFTSDNYLVLAAAAEAGMGALPMPVMRHAFAGPSQLVPLPVELGPYKRLTYHLVCAKSALDIPRVRLLADLFVSEMEAAIAAVA